MFWCSKKEILLFLLCLTVAAMAKSQISSMDSFEDPTLEHDTTFQFQQSGNPFSELENSIEMVLAPTETEKKAS